MRLAGALLLDEKDEQIVLHPIGAGLKFARRSRAAACRGAASSASSASTAAARGARIVGMATVDAQAAAVRGQLLHVAHAQAGAGEYRGHRVERQVGKMLVVDRVELRVLDEAHQVRKFERDRPTGFQRGLESRREVVDVGHVGIDIVADDQIGLLSFGGKLLRQSPFRRIRAGPECRGFPRPPRCSPSARCRGTECPRRRSS